MNTQEFIEKFHHDFWLNPSDLPYMNFRFSYYNKRNDNHYDMRKHNYDPYYQISEYGALNIPDEWGVLGKTNDRIISEHMLSNFNSIVEKYIGHSKQLTKKFAIGDYNFYIYFNSGPFKDRNSDGEIYQVDDFSVYLEYHGFTNKILNLYKQEQKEKHKLSSRQVKIKGYFIFLEFLKNVRVEDLTFEDYKIEDVFGQWEPDYYFWLDPITPKDLCKYVKEKSKYSIGKKYIIRPIVNKVDLDFFIKMFTNKGIYKPNKKIYDMLNKFQNEPKSSMGLLKDLGVDLIQFQNNSAYDITKYYDLTGVSIKCSGSVLKDYPDLRKFHINKELAENITKKEKEEKLRVEREEKERIANDTYTLYQFGVPILKDVRSHEIEEYFDNKSDSEFENRAIQAAKKVFEASPELDVFYFMHYGIYTYTEMAGEKFCDYENLASINKLKGNELPNRIITLLNLGEIEFPYFDKYDNNVQFDAGATFIGVRKSQDTYTLVYEEGEQGI
jgi:hypothetical protein